MHDRARLPLLTVGALVGFAGNSLLCRAALARGAIDPATFTAVRMIVGAVVLVLLARLRFGALRAAGSWSAAAALLAYAVAFSFAYVRIGAGVGALVLFAAVQATMVGAAVVRGQRPGARQWLGIALGLGGLAALALPGARAPDPLGLALMVAAGAAWGLYSLAGRTSVSPLDTTASNFARTVPAALLLALLASGAHATTQGLVLAAVSGGLTSAIAYALWYAALPSLGAVRASVVQLAVPVVAAVGGIALLDEAPTLRLAAAAAAILAGIALATLRAR